MFVLITYDVETITPEGSKRLRKVAKACQDYGIRVQNSVFECVVDSAQYVLLKNRLKGIIDAEHDNVRFYSMGDNWERKIESFGKDTGTHVTDCLIV